jgi:hypothetical protein
LCIACSVRYARYVVMSRQCCTIAQKQIIYVTVRQCLKWLYQFWQKGIVKQIII